MQVLPHAVLDQWSSDFSYSSQLCGGVILESLLYGINLMLFVASTHKLLKGRNRSAGVIFQASAFCAMFALSTGLWAMDVANLVIYLLRARLVLSPSPAAASQLERAVADAGKLLLAGRVMFEADFLIGDVLIAWRVLVLYRSQRAAQWIRLVFILLGLGTAGVVIRETACWIPAVLSPAPATCIVLRKAAWAVSAALNLFASFLMWRVIRERRALLRTIPKVLGFSKTKVDRALYILLFTSILYVLSGLTVFISQFGLGYEAQLGFEYFITPASNQGIGLYPVVVSIFVLNQDAIFGPVPSSSTVAMNNATTPSMQFNGTIPTPDMDRETVEEIGLTATETSESGQPRDGVTEVLPVDTNSSVSRIAA